MSARIRSAGNALMLTVAVMGCTTPSTASPLRPFRPAGERSYRFTSTQVSPAGKSRVEVAFLLRTAATGEEIALVTRYRHATGDTPLMAGIIDSACASRLSTTPSAIVVLPITPPPVQLRDLIPACVPEDLFGAASDILPLLMIQVQPKYRASELRHVGDRLRFDGYRTGWRQPPALLDASIIADSGVTSLDSITPSYRVIGWNTSPMRVALVRQVAPGQRMLLRGQEWFWAQVVVDHGGVLLRGRTVVDSLALRVLLPYADSVVPTGEDPPASGPLVSVSRTLELRLDDTSRGH